MNDLSHRSSRKALESRVFEDAREFRSERQRVVHGLYPSGQHIFRP